jgi:hypothetical protein
LQDQEDLHEQLGRYNKKFEDSSKRHQKLKSVAQSEKQAMNNKWSERVSKLKAREFVINPEEHRDLNFNSLPAHLKGEKRL